MIKWTGSKPCHSSSDDIFCPVTEKNEAWLGGFSLLFALFRNRKKVWEFKAMCRKNNDIFALSYGLR